MMLDWQVLILSLASPSSKPKVCRVRTLPGSPIYGLLKEYGINYTGIGIDIDKGIHRLKSYVDPQ